MQVSSFAPCPQAAIHIARPSRLVAPPGQPLVPAVHVVQGGPVGPLGPVGPVGPLGPVGPAGPVGLLVVNMPLYLVREFTHTTF